MNLLEIIKNAGIVGCGGAGFPTHVKMNCQVEYLIINGAECEPLLRTDRWLMRHKAKELIQAVEEIGIMVQASHLNIALKETYEEEINCLQQVIDCENSKVSLHLLPNFYPAGDEQAIVLEVTGRTVPPAGIPLDVGAVVSNVATVYAIYEAMQGIPFTHKYLTVTGEVREPVIVHTPVGTSFRECIQAAGGSLYQDYCVIAGGPLMGKVYTKEEAKKQAVTKTTSGIVVIPTDIPLVTLRNTPMHTILRRAKSACIQCSRCTDLCPRYLSGHPLKPHKIMRKLAYSQSLEEVLDDFDVRQAQICSECGVCETFACPMGLYPRQVNACIKQTLAKEKIRYERTGDTWEEREARSYRKVPSRRIAARLGVDKYYDYEIDKLVELSPDSIEIPLKQHIGAPSVAMVKENDTVQAGQQIGVIPENAMGANIYCGIAGIVTKADTSVTVKKA